jgi:hypothetical protein
MEALKTRGGPSITFCRCAERAYAKPAPGRLLFAYAKAIVQ